MSVISLVYMRVFLQESMSDNRFCGKSTETDCLLEKAPSRKWKLFKDLPSVDDAICLLKTRSATFTNFISMHCFNNLDQCHKSIYYSAAQLLQKQLWLRSS